MTLPVNGRRLEQHMGVVTKYASLTKLGPGANI
jgi:hypothetical protein